MFDESYAYNQIGKEKPLQGDRFSIADHYRFKSKKTNHSYIVRVEHYPEHIYALKFFSKEYKDSERKYNILTGRFEASRIIASVLKVFTSEYIEQEDPQASLAFIGTPVFNEQAQSNVEAEMNTRRFQLYEKIMSIYFSPVNYEHYYYTEKSVYLLRNRSNKSENLLSTFQNLIVSCL